jgi:hypothetical protein
MQLSTSRYKKLPNVILIIPLFLFLMAGSYDQLFDYESSYGSDSIYDYSNLKSSFVKIKHTAGIVDQGHFFSLDSNHDILDIVISFFFNNSSLLPAFAYRAPPA